MDQQTPTSNFLTAAQNSRHSHLRPARYIVTFMAFRLAIITVSAGLSRLLTKILAHGLAATTLAVQEREQLPCLRDLHALYGLTGIAVIGPHQAAAHISGAKQGNPFSRLPITARAANFLPIGFHRFWWVGMDHKPYIWFIDPHAKGHGRAHDQTIFE